MQGDRRIILLTGATGYVGGRLLPLLEARGEALRCLARNTERLSHVASPATQIVRGDVLDGESLYAALRGVHTAYYLVHSMAAARDFAESDAIGARNFAEAAARQGVSRIIYLGGLGETSSTLSKHLRSRQEVGAILRESGVPTTEFRASIIIGAGSLSFELVRALVERLPVMITPRWVAIPAQPIAIRDVLEYLIRALDAPDSGSRIYEIGGADVVSYGEMMRSYAAARGLKRLMLRVPVLTPGLSSLWLGLVTPVYARVGRKLIESVRNSTLVRDDSALRDFPIRPLGISDAVREAMESEDAEFAAMRFSEFFARATANPYWGGVRLGCRMLDTRTTRVNATPEEAFRVISSIGGKTGYFSVGWLWRLRGLIDRMIGGVGMRRGRTRAAELRVGDEIDWWRVERVEPGRLLRLRAEMKLPGRAWLDFEVIGEQDGTTIRQTAVFDPVGLVGALYWWALYPAHAVVFRGMLMGIAKRCARSPSEGTAEE